MPKTIPQRKLRNENAAVIDAVVAGETFIVTRNGMPVAEIGPVSNQRRTFVPKSDLLATMSNSSRIDFDGFRADLDRVINPNF